MKNYIIFILIFFTVYNLLQSQSVTEWRGKDRMSIYPEKDLLKSWPEQGPELIWSNEQLPKAYSSVSILDNKIYITGRKDSSDYLLALNALNGQIIWETAYGRSWHSSFPEARCTPTLNNNYAYVTSGKGDIACIQLTDGKIKWSLKAWEQFEGTNGNWGVSESPVVFENNVFITTGGKKTNVVALDKFSGKVAWMTESLDDKPAYASPRIVEKDGMFYLVGLTEKYTYAIDCNSGKFSWKFKFGDYSKENKNNHSTTPIYFNNKLFLTSGYNHKSVMLNWAKNETQVSVAWVDTVLDVHLGGAVLVNGYVYGSNWQGNGMGKWCCLDWNTGKLMYEQKWNNKGSIISDGENIYIYEEKAGNIALAKASPDSLTIISSFKITKGTGPHWSVPVICNGVMYIRHNEALMAFKIK